MSIKERIGERITQSRKALGITIKELAARTGELSAARISNWEQGTRSPGPMEARLLANVLNVSASFLLCLTDNPGGEISTSSNAIQLLPILTFKEAYGAKEYLHQNNILEDSKTKIIIDNIKGRKPGDHAFAVEIEDNSMEPSFHKHELIIVDTGIAPNPGDYVLAYIPQKNQTYLRKYSESSSKDCLYQLIAHNELWATIEVTNNKDAVIVGTVIEHRRYW
ncbi:helix-turn-helix domain-containing protein [Legionella spiritensis]|uniref:helix-turn-helix domain-containing protein n=1 Tax=Legionella spiritensis TaxID=452 RepID=UPI000F6DA75B|nr:XRE family transcriptional regulator [Legionella spiritensis]VEG91773.1 phage repressor [Legionella spiritensis]